MKYALDSLFVETVGYFTLKDLGQAVSNRGLRLGTIKEPHIETTTCILNFQIIKRAVIPKKINDFLIILALRDMATYTLSGAYFEQRPCHYKKRY